MNEPFLKQLDALIDLAAQRCEATPQSEQMGLQLADLRRCRFREDKVAAELKAKADFAARQAAAEAKATKGAAEKPTS